MSHETNPSPSPSSDRAQPWPAFGGWMLLALLAAIAVIPYTMDILSTGGQRADSLSELAWTVVPERMFLSAIAIGIGLTLGPRLGLPSPATRHWRHVFGSATMCGIATGIAVLAISSVLEPVLIPELPENARRAEEVASRMEPWKVILASFSAGVTEELLFRFGAVTFFAWLLGKVVRGASTRGVTFWIANALAAGLFGLAHLSNVIDVGIPVTPGVVSYVALVNGTAGLAFGWLYWRHGIAAAIVAHVVADLVLKWIVPMVTSG